MDYKQKYEEALKKARSFELPEYKNIMESVFPELKESEDEKIRKDIIVLLDFGLEDGSTVAPGCSTTKEQAIAWLEKQKTSEEAIKYLEENHSPSEISDFQAAMNIAVAKAYDRGRRDAEKQCQKSKKVSIWKHWNGGIVGNGNGEQVYLIKTGNVYDISSVLNWECDYIELSELDNLMLEKQGELKEYTFKSLPRLLDMVEPTERAKAYCQKLIDTLVKEGYSTDAKIVGDCLKQMNGEKVAMATMDEKQDEQRSKLIDFDYNANDSDLQEVTYFIPNGFHAEIDGNKVVIKQGESKPVAKVKPKYHEGDWVVISTSDGRKVVKVVSIEYYPSGQIRYITSEGRWFGNGTKARLLTDKDVEITTIPESKAIVNKIKSWSEEDEEELEIAIETLREAGQHSSAEWLKSLKQRIGG